MSAREQAKEIIDRLPDYKLNKILIFLQGVLFDDELEDDLYCEWLADRYEADPSPDKHDTISLEELAKREGMVI